MFSGKSDWHEIHLILTLVYHKKLIAGAHTQPLPNRQSPPTQTHIIYPMKPPRAQSCTPSSQTPGISAGPGGRTEC